MVGDLRENVFNISYERVARKTYILSGEIDDRNMKTALIDTLVNHGFHIQDSLIVLPHEVLSSRAFIDLSVTTMRSFASHVAPIVSQALMGMPVRVLKQKGGWAYIQTPDRYLGWCEKSALLFTEKKEWEKWKNAPRVMITSRYSVIRDTVSTDVLGDLVAGCIVEKTLRQNDHVFIKTPGGIEGYVEASEATSFDRGNFPDTLDVRKLETTALSLIRTPYLWGGTSVSAMDCSGFTKTVYRQQGIMLARDASLQALYGQKIPVDEGWEIFKKGDLLFFAPSEGSDRITHVGIYLDNSEFIHEAGKVKINSFDSTSVIYSRYRTNTLVKARRIDGQYGTEGIVHLMEHPWYVKK
ncbi:MAG: C40 family peptidase [Spirochaetales bacterium]|nr:C40 family peptidase [Spirochaetales bacterium]